MTFLDTNKDKTPEEFKKGYDELITKYTQGQSKEYLQTFFPEAINTQAEVEGKIKTYQVGLLKEQEIGKIKVILKNNFTTNYKSITEQVLAVKLNSLSDIENDPELYMKYTANQTKINKLAGVANAKSLHDIQKQTKEWGFLSNTKEISTFTLDTLKELNFETGLDFSGLIHETDSSGISLINSSLSEQAMQLEIESGNYVNQNKKEKQQEYDKKKTQTGLLSQQQFIQECVGKSDLEVRATALAWKRKLPELKREMSIETHLNLTQMIENWADPIKTTGKGDMPFLRRYYTEQGMGNVNIPFYQNNFGNMAMEELSIISNDIASKLGKQAQNAEEKGMNFNQYFAGAQTEFERMVLDNSLVLQAKLGSKLYSGFVTDMSIRYGSRLRAWFKDKKGTYDDFINHVLKPTQEEFTVKSGAQENIQQVKENLTLLAIKAKVITNANDAITVDEFSQTLTIKGTDGKSRVYNRAQLEQLGGKK